MRVYLFLFYIPFIFQIESARAQETVRKYLSGTGYDNTVEWNFYCTAGRESGHWSRIPVPSCWETEGFGTYNYGLDPDSVRGNEKGMYRYNFEVPAAWRNKSTEIVFEGSMTDTEVKINGLTAGPVHQGGFYEFRYDVSTLLKYGRENLLEVTVSKRSADFSVNSAERHSDYWIFGGIYRPVYLEVRPSEHIDHFTTDAKADGSLRCMVYTTDAGRSLVLEGRLYDRNNKPVGPLLSSSVSADSSKTILSGTFENIEEWSPEFPVLYSLEIRMKRDNTLLHIIRQKIGFRTVEVRSHDGIYVNGTKIMFKGVCRHSFWPESGRTTSRKLSVDDVLLIKSMNMNAVRMSHYPPDSHFLDACDSLGLYVLDELGGWQTSYDTDIGEKLVREMILRDINHPSIVLWDNGNEGGWNTHLDDDFLKYDPQAREVIHPRADFRKTDTHHYIEYNYGTSDFFNGDQIFFPTEFLHGLYDGGTGAGLDDYWSLMRSRPLSAGGFLWAFIDESVVRTDRKGILDSDGNHAPDGILGPHREKEGSYYTIKEIWSPVYFDPKVITKEFNGRLKIQNRYDFTNLRDCDFKYKLVSFIPDDKKGFSAKTDADGSLESPDISPGCQGEIIVGLPDTWTHSDALYITARDPYNRNINTWSWSITDPETFTSRLLNIPDNESPAYTDKKDTVVFSNDVISVSILKRIAQLAKVMSAGKIISLSNGPELAQGERTFLTDTIYSGIQGVAYECVYKGNLKLIRWTLSGNGILKLEVHYRPDDNQPYYGINFDFPESKVKGISWIGKGPYRVWKNRMKGTNIGFWHNDYNNTITGVTYDYPEFKGYFEGLYWMKLYNDDKDFKIFTETDHVFLRLYTPEEPPDPLHTRMLFPGGDLSFLQGISPIGTKFHRAEELGPESQLNKYNSNKAYLSIILYFDFR